MQYIDVCNVANKPTYTLHDVLDERAYVCVHARIADLCLNVCTYEYTYTVSQNKLHKLFLSELSQIFINFDNFW